MENQKQNLIAAIEAILFAYGEPMEIKKIAKILSASEEEVELSLKEFEEKLKDENRGLMLILSENSAQLATKPEFSEFLESFIREEFKENLTPASLETLALIAYLGPISRAKIDYLRGVNSSFILRNLMMRGLIERISGSYEYQASFDLLKNLGISKISELPDFDKFKDFAKEQTKEHSQTNV
ncbi:SMC-Scp complex subunit ScpB [Candidatus Wolfebacteria bacterium]|nr:SMC-Scp complex subunit ScpB [Candidatus Wolfebacteria bacterium]